MFVYRIMKGAAVSLATIGMMMPQAYLHADATPSKAVTGGSVQTNRIPDIVLGEEGTMSGRVCDHTGSIVEGAKVTLKQDNKVIGTTVTDKDGIYSFKNLKGGTYQPSSGNTEGVFRVWTAKTAPKTAKQQALLVMGENGARGQFGGIDPLTVIVVAGAATAIALGAVALARYDSLNTKYNNLQNQVNNLSTTTPTSP